MVKKKGAVLLGVGTAEGRSTAGGMAARGGTYTTGRRSISSPRLHSIRLTLASVCQALLLPVRAHRLVQGTSGGTARHGGGSARFSSDLGGREAAAAFGGSKSEATVPHTGPIADGTRFHGSVSFLSWTALIGNASNAIEW